MISKYTLSIITLIILLNLGAVHGADFESHDFDGNFRMDVPSGSSFEKLNTLFGLDIGPSNAYRDFENDMNISYSSVGDDDKYFNDMIKTMKEEPNVDVAKEGDLYLITTEKYHMVVFHENHKIIAISAANPDFDCMKKMAKSTERG